MYDVSPTRKGPTNKPTKHHRSKPIIAIEGMDEMKRMDMTWDEEEGRFNTSFITSKPPVHLPC